MEKMTSTRLLICGSVVRAHHGSLFILKDLAREMALSLFLFLLSVTRSVTHTGQKTALFANFRPSLFSRLQSKKKAGMISGSSIAAIEVVFFLISFQLLSLSFRIARIRLNLQTRRAGQVRKHSTSPL